MSKVDRTSINEAKRAAIAFLETSPTDPQRGRFRKVLSTALAAGVITPDIAKNFGINNGDASATFAGNAADVCSEIKREVCAAIANMATAELRFDR